MKPPDITAETSSVFGRIRAVGLPLAVYGATQDQAR